MCECVTVLVISLDFREVLILHDVGVFFVFSGLPGVAFLGW